MLAIQLYDNKTNKYRVRIIRILYNFLRHFFPPLLVKLLKSSKNRSPTTSTDYRRNSLSAKFYIHIYYVCMHRSTISSDRNHDYMKPKNQKNRKKNTHHDNIKAIRSSFYYHNLYNAVTTSHPPCNFHVAYTHTHTHTSRHARRLRCCKYYYNTVMLLYYYYYYHYGG